MFDSSLEESINSMITQSDRSLRSAGANSKADKLKRPLNAYNLFFMEQQPLIKASRPEMSGNAISKELGHQWKSMSVEQRQPYVIRAKIIHEEFKAANPNYHYSKSPKPNVKRAIAPEADSQIHDAENMLLTLMIMQNKEIVNSIQQSIQPNLLPKLMSEFMSKGNYTKTN